MTNNVLMYVFKCYGIFLLLVVTVSSRKLASKMPLALKSTVPKVKKYDAIKIYSRKKVYFYSIYLLYTLVPRAPSTQIQGGGGDFLNYIHKCVNL